MIEKFIERSEGTIIVDRGAWAADAVYSVWNTVNDNYVVYRCILGHIAAAANRPGIGASWGTYWSVFGPVGVNRALELTFDGGGVVLTTGVKGGFQAPFNMKIISGTLLSIDGTVGSLQVQLWKDTYVNFPPTTADQLYTFSFTNAIKSTENLDSAHGILSAGDIVLLNIDYVTNIKFAVLALIIGAL